MGEQEEKFVPTEYEKALTMGRVLQSVQNTETNVINLRTEMNSKADKTEIMRLEKDIRTIEKDVKTALRYIYMGIGGLALLQIILANGMK